MLTDARAVAERWEEYSRDMYNHVPIIDDAIMPKLRNRQQQEQDAPIIREEVVNAVKHLKRGRASGADNIPVELIQAEGELIQAGRGELIQAGRGAITIDLLMRICNGIWQTGQWPKQWTQSVIIPLPKKGNMKECENYRTISLICHASKVMLRIVLNKLQPQADIYIAEEQAGFQARRSTVEQIFKL